jgi:hypothetical protein
MRCGAAGGAGLHGYPLARGHRSPEGARKRGDVRDDLILDLKDREGLSFEEIGRRVHMSKTGALMRYYALTGRERPERAKTTDSITAGNGETGAVAPRT